MLQGTDKNDQSDSAEKNHFLLLLLAFLQAAERYRLKSMKLLYMWEGWDLCLCTEDENGATEKIIFLPFFQYQFFSVDMTLFNFSLLLCQMIVVAVDFCSLQLKITGNLIKSWLSKPLSMHLI